MGVGMTTKPLTMGIWCYNFDDCVFCCICSTVPLLTPNTPDFLARGDIMVIWATVKISEDQFSREGLKMTLDMHETLQTDMAPPKEG